MVKNHQANAIMLHITPERNKISLDSAHIARNLAIHETFPNKRRLTLKITRVDPIHQVTIDRVPSNALRVKEALVVFHTFSTKTAAELKFVLELFSWKSGLIKSILRMTNGTQTIFYKTEVSEQRG